MSDTENVVKHIAIANDNLHSTKANAEDFTDFENTKVI